VIEYYLALLPGVIPAHARRRLELASPLDGSQTPLTMKLLARPRLLERIRSLIPDPNRAHLVPFLTTEVERDLAVALGIPMYGADPKHLPLGTKTGSRRLFADEGVPHPEGVEDVHSVEDVVEAVGKIRARRSELQRILVKLNEGVSGLGNATADVGAAHDPSALADAVRSMHLEAEDGSIDDYLETLAAEGGVVEELVGGAEIRSPSVQMRVTPLGRLEILSTHDQLLGGPGGQTYLGAAFPADPAYARAITIEAEKIGRRLAKEGVLGRFAVDFVVVRGAQSSWDPYAIEINLRKGGTTHPFLTLQFLTDGTYDAETAAFRTPSGAEKCFVASDHLDSDTYRGFTPTDLFDLAVRRGIHFDQSRETGVVFHMLAALASDGRLGLTAVEDSAQGARELFDRSVAILNEEAAGSFSP
jgi:hypothetical protein